MASRLVQIKSVEEFYDKYACGIVRWVYTPAHPGIPPLNEPASDMWLQEPSLQQAVDDKRFWYYVEEDE